uniref:Uncharacterized protein n=1 Tax=Anguilla anguilla TaxID=7936 RepID=A0A0E9XMG1_ANGAN
MCFLANKYKLKFMKQFFTLFINTTFPGCIIILCIFIIVGLYFNSISKTKTPNTERKKGRESVGTCLYMGFCPMVDTSEEVRTSCCFRMFL